nr:cytochrome P450 [Patulibacter sp. SYSU D01012]
MDADAALDELLVVMAAAQEPPAIALSSILDRLGREPDLAAAVRDAGPDAPLFSATIAETLRLRPPAMASLRRLQEPLTLGGFDLPAGTNVMVPFVLLHRDPDVFTDPDRFDPDRFLDAPAPPSFLPFGGGVRRCPAEPLAGVEFGAVVPTVLDRLRLHPLSLRPERLVQRATVLVPQRSGLVLAERRGA